MKDEFLIDEAAEGRLYLLNELTEETKDEFLPLLRSAISGVEPGGCIEILIDTVGGDAYCCLDIMELIEFAKRQDIIVKTIVPAMAASSGSNIAITGTMGYRFIGRWAEHLVHYGQYHGQVVTNPTQQSRENLRWQRWTKASEEIYKHYCNIPSLKSKMKDDSFWIPAKDCISWGLADRYIEEWK